MGQFYSWGIFSADSWRESSVNSSGWRTVTIIFRLGVGDTYRHSKVKCHRLGDYVLSALNCRYKENTARFTQQAQSQVIRKKGRVRMEGTRFFSLACVRSGEFKPQRPWRTEERNGGRKASREEAAFQSPRKNSLGSENTQPHSALRNRCGGPYIESYRTLCRQKFLSYGVLSGNHTEV